MDALASSGEGAPLAPARSGGSDRADPRECDAGRRQSGGLDHMVAGGAAGGHFRSGDLRRRRRRFRPRWSASARKTGRGWRGQDGEVVRELRFVGGAAERQREASAAAAGSGRAGERGGRRDFCERFAEKTPCFDVFLFRSFSSRNWGARSKFSAARGLFAKWRARVRLGRPIDGGRLRSRHCSTVECYSSYSALELGEGRDMLSFYIVSNAFHLRACGAFRRCVHAGRRACLR